MVDNSDDMKSKPKNLFLWIIGLIAFYVTAAISLWKLVDKGMSLTTAIPAVCFPLAAVLWTIGLRNIRRKSKDDGDENV
jgi:hypothetical protein